MEAGDVLSLYLTLFALAVLLDAGLILAWRYLRRRKQGQVGQAPEDPTPVADENPAEENTAPPQSAASEMSARGRETLRGLRMPTHRGARYWWVVAELVILALWALWVGRAYLDFNPDVTPGGREYGSAIQAHHLWTRAQQCGLCALWDGSERGGFPALVDTLGSALHPLVIATTSAWGVVNGSKVALIVALWLGGLAQWWLAREMKLGWPARAWSGMLGTSAGHLAGRMELGIFSVVLSTAMAALIFPAALAVARSGKRRATVLLAVILALTIVAGQGYIQAGLLFLSPAFLILVLDKHLRLRPVWREYAIAVGLALLLAALFLVPLLHFWPHFVKDSDPTLGAMQPLKYFVLNLVIGDFEFLMSDILHKLPYPHLYTMYVGWTPVLLAALCLKFGQREDRRTLLFLAASIALALLTASGVILRLLQPIVPAVAALRYAPIIGGLAVPPLLGLAAYGLDRLLAVNWPQLSLHLQDSQGRRAATMNLKWLLVIPLVWSLYVTCDFAQNWLYVTNIDPGTYDVLQALHTPSLQWVEPPPGEHWYIEPAVRMGLKLSPGIMTWRWRDRPFPEPYLEANYIETPPDFTETRFVNDWIPIYGFKDRVYAFVQTGDEMIPCRAFGTGGDLLIKCSTREAGTLIVRENSWTGWYAWRDQERAPLLNDRWLSVKAPAGEHYYRFRYLPWDVLVGILLWAIGIALCVWQWSSPTSSRMTARE
jgi:hypothetical protein